MMTNEPAVTANLSIADAPSTDYNTSVKKNLDLMKKVANGDNSFYGSEVEPLAGFESKKSTNQLLNHTTNDGYGTGNETMPSILPNIKRSQLGTHKRRLTKPSKYK